MGYEVFESGSSSGCNTRSRGGARILWEKSVSKVAYPLFQNNVNFEVLKIFNNVLDHIVVPETQVVIIPSTSIYPTMAVENKIKFGKLVACRIRKREMEM